MADRLSPWTCRFLYLEEPDAHACGQRGGVRGAEDGFDHDRLVSLIRTRIAFVPRYRQRVRWVPGRVANPVWVDDESFDVTYHVRRSALPRPGTDAQLRELVARIMSRPLDQNRPLWEMYLIEGLEGGPAILSKSHHAMVDGMAAVGIGQVILDVTPEPRAMGTDVWRPAREPSALELFVGGMSDTLRSPASVVDSVVKSGLGDVRETAVDFGRNVAGS